MEEKLPFRFGSEVYTWFMNNNGKTHEGRLGHMIEVIAKAGFTGIQPIHFWMGDLSDPERLEEKLKQEGIELCAIALALDWNGAKETEKERNQNKQRKKKEHTLIAEPKEPKDLKREKREVLIMLRRKWNE